MNGSWSVDDRALPPVRWHVDATGSLGPMRRGRVVAGWLAAVLLVGCAADARIDAEVRAAADAEIARAPAAFRHGQARAWVVRRDGGGDGLLWGTMHVGYSGDTVLPAPIRERFYAAEDLTVETVLDRLAPDEAQRLRTLYRTANETPDPVAVARLDPVTKQALDDSVTDSSASRLSLRGLASRVAARAMTEPLGGLPTVGFVDINLIAFARSQGRTVRGLETPQTPDPTLRDPNGDDAAGMLRLNLRRADALRPMTRWVREAYGRGDIAGAVAALIAFRARPDDLVRYDRDRTALLADRNAAWLPRLERIFRRPGQHFVAVGAGHLLGDDGLVALLRAHGWQVLPCLADACP